MFIKGNVRHLAQPSGGVPVRPRAVGSAMVIYAEDLEPGSRVFVRGEVADGQPLGQENVLLHATNGWVVIVPAGVLDVPGDGSIFSLCPFVVSSVVGLVFLQMVTLSFWGIVAHPNSISLWNCAVG